MSAKRKLRRSQKSSNPAVEHSAVDKDALRLETSDERFKRPGSAKLWQALLGWDELRRSRMWLAQAVNDASRSSEPPLAVVQSLLLRYSVRITPLTEADLEQTVTAWRSPGSAPATTPWQTLSRLCERAGLGEADPDVLRRDWELWTNLALASKPRMALMSLLQQGEQAGLELDQLTDSENMRAVANVSRALWFALAYGDEATFETIREWSAGFHPKLPSR